LNCGSENLSTGNMKVIQNSQVERNKWKKLLNNNPYASPFQSQQFYEYYNSVGGLSADVFAVEENGEYTALSVVTLQKEDGFKGYFSRRGIVYGGPLIKKNNRDSISLLLNNLIDYYRSKLIYIEIRNFFDYSHLTELSNDNKWQFLPYLNFKITLKNRQFEEIVSDMKYNRRRQIRLSLERNVIYKECETESELELLCQILEKLYKTRVKLPLPHYEYFKALWKSEIGKVFVVIHNTEIIGGSICVILKNHSIYTIYYCGLRDYDKKIFPTHLAILAAIEYGINNGMEYLDFMGAGLKGEEYGVRKYKQEFGGELNEYGRYRNILQPTLFNIGVKGLEILKKINL
jgi:serine/alanine adding enzyme